MRAVTSASNFFRRVLCPGSQKAELGFPEEESKAAAKGTFLHYKDATGEDADEIDEQELLDINKSLRDRYLSFKMQALGIPENANKVEISETEDLAYFVMSDTGDLIEGVDGKPLGGHPDRIIYFPAFKVLFVFDSKFGRKAVDLAPNNYQLRIYSIMLADPDWGDFDAERVFAVITQPLAKPQIHAVEYDKESLRSAKGEVLQFWYQAQNPEAPRIPSNEACGYCKANGSCPEGLEFLKSIVGEKISEIPIPDLEAMMPRIELAESIVTKYWARIRYIAEKCPHLLEKHELSKATDTRSLNEKDMTEAYVRLSRAGLITAEQFAHACKLSFTKLERMIAKNLKLKTEEAKFRVEATLSDLIQLKPKRGKLIEKQTVLLEENNSTKN